MKIPSLRKILSNSLRVVIASSIITSSAYAIGTAQGTSVQTTYTIDYAVASVNQTQISSSSSAFLIGRKIDLDVSQTAASFNVTPGGTNQYMSFTLTNTGNATQGYLLTTNVTDSNSIINGSVAIYVENGTTVGFQAGQDTLYTTNTNAGDLAADGLVTIYVVATIQNNAQSAETATVALVATTTDAGTATPTTSHAAVAWNPAASQTVFADGEGIASLEDPQDGKHSDSADFSVGGADLQVTQTVVPLYDYNASGTPTFCKEYTFSAAQTNAKVIPGGCVHFTYTITNNGNTQADTVVWRITLPTQLTYAGANVAEAEHTTNVSVCNGTGNFNTANATTTGFICNIASIAPAGTVTVKFRATVD